MAVNDRYEIDGEWDTLVNPRRDVGRTDIHGITAGHLAGAPAFEDIAGDLLDLLAGRVVVCHNARFDVGFLAAEYQRLGHRCEPTALCTLELASQHGFPRRSSDCCDHLGVLNTGPHQALDDARATAQVMRGLVGHAHQRGAPPYFVPYRPAGPDGLGRSRRRYLRAEGTAPKPNEAFVATLVRRLPPTATGADTSGAAMAYVDVLEGALEDRVLTSTEMEELADLAAAWSLTAVEVDAIHRDYLAALVGVALADHHLSAAEAADLQRVADLLHIGRSDLNHLLGGAATTSPPAGRIPPVTTPGVGDLAGMTVCFTGASTCTRGGAAIKRADAEALATAAGLVVAPRVTKTLELLVVADPDTLSAKAEKARDYGTRIIAERVLWRTLGIEVD